MLYISPCRPMDTNTYIFRLDVSEITKLVKLGFIMEGQAGQNQDLQNKQYDMQLNL
jgi:hypothetical protein